MAIGSWSLFTTMISPHRAHCTALGLFMNPQWGHGTLGLLIRLMAFAGEWRYLPQVHLHRLPFHLRDGEKLFLLEAEGVGDDV